MKKAFVLMLTLAMIVGFGGIATATSLKLGLDADPVSLDPHVQLSGGMLAYSHWVFDPLVRYAQDMSIEPRLATRWERLDDLTMRFFLRRGGQVPQRQSIHGQGCGLYLGTIEKECRFQRFV